MTKPYLRLCFEPQSGVSINDENTFCHLASGYLDGFNAEFGGYIAVNGLDTKQKSMEPLWQYLIRESTQATRDYLIEYLDRNPMAGYYVHVYEASPRHETKKVF